MSDTAVWTEHVLADDCPCRPDVQLVARGSARVATHRDMPEHDHRPRRGVSYHPKRDEADVVPGEGDQHMVPPVRQC